MASLRSPPLPFRFPAPAPHIDDRADIIESTPNSRPQSSHNEEAMSSLRIGEEVDASNTMDTDNAQDSRESNHRPSRSDATATSKDSYDLPSSRPSKFRFKDKDRPRSSRDRSRERRREDLDERSDRHRSSKRKADREHTHQRRRHRSKSPSHRSKRHKSSLPTSSHPSPPPQKRGIYEPDDPVLDQEALFRESLFDALADDEGAQFWEGVYGQPIPFDPPYKESTATEPDSKGELERMSEEEYIQHIRQEMWKKTHQALLEERAEREKRRREKEKIDEEERRKAREDVEFQRRVDESLRRGRERKDQALRAQGWKDRWTRYLAAWDSLSSSSSSSSNNGTRIPWPVYTGSPKDLDKDEIETFLSHGSGGGIPDREEFVKALKTERVRWHPDKMQQKLGKLDEETLKNVIMVFQIIDELWSRNK